MGDTWFGNGADGVQRIHIIKLVSSAPDALQLEFCAVVEVIRYDERSGTVSCTDPDPVDDYTEPSS